MVFLDKKKKKKKMISLRNTRKFVSSTHFLTFLSFILSSPLNDLQLIQNSCRYIKILFNFPLKHYYID